MSIRCSVLASPLNASTTSYGEPVRASGISESGSSWPAPAGSSARNIAPSRVLTRIEAPVSVAELRALVDPELHQDMSVVESDVLDLADADAGDPDLVVRPSARPPR